MGSFINAHYRSAVVMLWSVVMADLVYKLQALRDLYSDSVAQGILDAIAQKQIANPTSPEWEVFLLDQVNEKLELFETADYQHLVNIQKLRHLSAHPVLSGTNLLFAPNKETARACIRNALEAVLLKPPIFSKKIVAALVADVSAVKALLPDDASLKQYLEAKYFKGLHASIEQELMKALWKFCFRLSNADTDSNREINVRVLKLLYAKKPAEFRQYVGQHAQYFSDVAPSGAPLTSLVDFLSTCPSIYAALTDAAKTPLKTFVRLDVNLLAISFFAFDNKADLIQILESENHAWLAAITDETWVRFQTLAADYNLHQAPQSIGIKIYVKSTSFSDADANFSKCILPIVESLDQVRMEELLAGIEANTQTYWRGRAKMDHLIVHARAVAIGGIDLSQYTNFLEYLA